MRKFISNSGDYMVVRTEELYSDFQGKEKWIIVTDLEPEILIGRYTETMKMFSPFILMTTLQWEAIEESCREEERRRKERARHEVALPGKTEEQEAIMPAEKSEMDKFEDKLDRILIRKMLDILTPAQKRRLRMFYFEGRSYQEIAMCEGVTRQSVKLSVKAGLRRLRAYFGKGADGSPERRDDPEE